MKSILETFLIGKESLFPLSLVGSGGVPIGWYKLSFFSIQLLEKLGKTFFCVPSLEDGLCIYSGRFGLCADNGRLDPP
jgi:hypothetical protein